MWTAIKAAFGFVTGNWQSVLIGIAAVVLVVGVEEWRLGGVTKQRDDLSAMHQNDIDTVAKAKQAVVDAQAETKKQADILGARAVAAEGNAKKIAALYVKIKGVKNADDGPVSPLLCAGVERLRFPATNSTDNVQLPNSSGNAASTGVAQSTPICTFTQRDLDLWLETEVKPAFDACVSQLQDIQKYVAPN